MITITLTEQQLKGLAALGHKDLKAAEDYVQRFVADWLSSVVEAYEANVATSFVDRFNSATPQVQAEILALLEQKLPKAVEVKP